jgi:hypothetical protein
MSGSGSGTDGKTRGKRLSKTSPKDINSKPRIKKYKKVDGKMAAVKASSSTEVTPDSLTESPEDMQEDISLRVPGNDQSMEENDGANEEERAPSEEPKWMAKMVAVMQADMQKTLKDGLKEGMAASRADLADHDKKLMDAVKSEINEHMTVVNSNIQNMEATLIKQVTEYEISLAFESGRIDTLEGRATTIETSARGVAKDAAILTKRVSDESKAIHD